MRAENDEARPWRGTGIKTSGDVGTIVPNSRKTAAWLGIATPTLSDLRDYRRTDRYLNLAHLAQMLRERPLQAERGGGRQNLEHRHDGAWLHALYYLGLLDQDETPAVPFVAQQLRDVVRQGRPPRPRPCSPPVWSCTREPQPATTAFLLEVAV